MPRSKSRSNIVFENDYLRITRRKNRGRKQPTAYIAESLVEGQGYPDGKLILGLDDVFDLAEALDDICDTIEDSTNTVA